MKGLIYKDLMGLKKLRVSFIFVTVVTMIIAVMALLSARFGNLAVLEQQYQVKGNAEFDVSPLKLLWYGLSFMMVLPVVAVGDVALNSFEADAKSGFINLAGALPVSVRQRVAARFITVLISGGTGLLISLIISFILSFLTDIMSFGDFAGIVLSAASLMIIFFSIEIVLIFLVKGLKNSYCGLVSMMIMIVAAGLIFFDRIQTAVREESYLNLISDALRFAQSRWYLLAIAAVVFLAVSFIVSSVVAERKRGDI